ncbi:MAG: hypothetical protein M0Q88_00915 [Bacilli bacterium]|nr:hypothetical protein [Bacilli bacterium]
MSIIKVKRKTSAPNLSTDKLLEGEIGLSGDYFAWGPTSGGTSEVGIAVAAVQNRSNVFSQKNTFNGEDLVLQAASNKTITFVDSGNNTKYTFGADGKFTTEHETFDQKMLVSKAYVDARVQGLNIKKSVKAASTVNLSGTLVESNTRLNLNAAGKLILDGVTDLAANDRVLIKNQSDENQNGIYIITTLGGTGINPSLKRADDADTPEKLRAAFVFVEEGETQADTGWNCITDTISFAPGGSIEWVQFSGAGSYNGDGDTITRDGTVFRLADQPGLSVLGVPTDESGKPTHITADSDETVLRRNGESLAFGTLPSGAFANNTIGYSRLNYSAVGGFLGHSGTSSGAITMISSSTSGHVPVIGSNSTLSFGQIGNSSIANNAAIAFSKLANGSAYSVLGVAGSAASVTSIAADTNTVLRRGASGNLGFGTITYAHIDQMTSNNLASIISDATGSGNLVFSTSPSLTTPSLGNATADTINNVSISTPGTSAGIEIANGQTLTVGKSLTFDASSSDISVDFGAGGNVAYTSGKLSQFASTTSAELAGVISDETGSGKLVFATSPTFTTSVTGSASMNVFNTASTTVNAFGAATTLSLGYTGTGNSVTNIAPGVTSSGTKDITIGTGGTGTSLTSITIGPTGGIFNTDINGVLATSSGTNIDGTFYRQDTAAIPTQTTRLKYAGWLYATRFEGLIDGGVWS